MDDNNLIIDDGSPQKVVVHDGDSSEYYTKIKYKDEGPEEGQHHFTEDLASKLDAHELTTLAQKLKEFVEADMLYQAQWLRSKEAEKELYSDTITPMENTGLGNKAQKDKQLINLPLISGETKKFQASVFLNITSKEPIRLIPTLGAEINTDIQKLIRKDEEQINLFMKDGTRNRGWFPDLDLTIEHAAREGSLFRLVSFDTLSGFLTTRMITANNFIVGTNTTNLLDCPRYTIRFTKTAAEAKALYGDKITNAIPTHVPSTELDDIDLDNDHVKTNEDPTRDIEFYEVYITLPELNDKGTQAPYTVTMLIPESGDAKIISLYRDYAEGPLSAVRESVPSHWKYAPSTTTFYGDNMAKVLAPYHRAATACFNLILENGVFMNNPSGFISDGVTFGNRHSSRKSDGELSVHAGEFMPVDVADISKSLGDVILPMPPTHLPPQIFEMLSFLFAQGMSLSGDLENKLPTGGERTPVDGIRLIMDDISAFKSSIETRFACALETEINQICPFIFKNGEALGVNLSEEVVKLYNEGMLLCESTYSSDTSNRALHVMNIRDAIQQSKETKGIYNDKILHHKYITEIGLSGVDQIIHLEGDVPPVDPLTENHHAVTGVPLKSHMQQNHDAHIQMHKAMLEMPELKSASDREDGKLIEAQNALIAHISEHEAMKLTINLSQQLGIAPPSPDQPLTEQVLGQLGPNLIPAIQEVIAEARMHSDAGLATEDMIAVRKQNLDELKVQADIKLDGDKFDLETAKFYVSNQDMLAKQGIATMEAFTKLLAQETQAEKNDDETDVKKLALMTNKEIAAAGNETSIEVAKIQAAAQTKAMAANKTKSGSK